MNEFVLARILHVLGVVFWIGGVAMVTTVLIPAMAKMRSASERMEFFQRIESRFVPRRGQCIAVGLTGTYMVHILEAWSRFAELRYWWMHAMVLVWAIFTLMLFVVEPFVLRRQVKQTDNGDADSRFRRMRRMHHILLTISLVLWQGLWRGATAGSFRETSMSYATLKMIHVTSVIISYMLFSLRGIWMMQGSLALKQRWAKIGPHLVDTVLLTSAIALAVRIDQDPIHDKWLSAKVLGLLLYIGLAGSALRFGKTRRARVWPG